MVFTILLGLFVIIPILEIGVLLRAGEALGVMNTLGVVVLTGVVGAAMARYEGLRVLGTIQSNLANGMMPAPQLVDGLLILVAGVVLLTPGFLTDAVGFFLLVPPCRAMVKAWVRRAFERRLRKGTMEATYWEW